MAKKLYNIGGCKAPGCLAEAKSLGYCKAHRERLRKHGALFPDKPIKHPPDGCGWLEKHVGYQGDECLPWPFGKSGNGYGMISFVRDGFRTYHAHIAMCYLAHGPKPEGRAEAAHTCGKGADGCVNPRHLRWATRAENEADKVAHGTSNRGSRHGMAKLVEADVMAIRTAKGIETQTALAARFGVSRPTISRIWNNHGWVPKGLSTGI